MATYIKNKCTACGDSPCDGVCGGCVTLQNALGLDDSVTSINVQLNAYQDGEITYTCNDVMTLGPCNGATFGAVCGFIEAFSINSENVPETPGTICGVLIIYVAGGGCRGDLFIPGTISLPFTSPQFFVYCLDGGFYVSITLS